MPELPEVEYAAAIARLVAVDRTIATVAPRHPAMRRALPPAVRATLAGDGVRAVERRGKHQLIRLTSGRTLHVHFRMTGDWSVPEAGAPLPAHARLVITFTDGARLVLDDPRALAVARLHAPDDDPLPHLGPEATDPAFNAAWLRQALARRRGPVKPALLDQGIVAGIGNIYASEALWAARVDPRRAANRLGNDRLQRVVEGIRRTLRKALRAGGRYYGDGASSAGRFAVYDREGRPCRRCGTAIRRIVQAARSTYYCPGCQR
jgi:formamidopyrimidine-DNA glycosylase